MTNHETEHEAIYKLMRNAAEQLRVKGATDREIENAAAVVWYLYERGGARVTLGRDVSVTLPPYSRPSSPPPRPGGFGARRLS